MFRISILTEASEGAGKLERELAERGFSCSVTASAREIAPEGSQQAPDLVLVNTNGQRHHARLREISRTIKEEKRLPVMVALNRGSLDIGSDPNIDDFVTRPLNLPELVLRIKRLIKQREVKPTGERITCGDLVIDLSRCEVYLGGVVVTLTFKEYQLLKFLATNQGRVFTREALLNKVWGYDYYGGDRTVDVHIRRLRSKLEGQGHPFIETVRNIGYRFRKHQYRPLNNPAATP